MTNVSLKLSTTVLQAKSDSDIMFCLTSYNGLLKLGVQVNVLLSNLKKQQHNVTVNMD